jgi:hypothetical protein
LLTNSAPIYTSKDTPLGKDEAYFSANLKFVRKNAAFQNSSSVEAILFHSDAIPYLGNKSDYYCCWDKPLKAGACSTPGRLIIESTAFTSRNLFYWDLNAENGTTSMMNEQIFILKSGVWRFYIANCGLTTDQEKSDSTTYVINGDVIFMNPYGHLAGSMIGSLPLFFILVFGYLVFGIAWLILSLKYRKDIMMLQKIISLVIIFGFLENLINGIDYAVYNKTGRIEIGST